MKNKYLFFIFVISEFFIHGSQGITYKDIQGLKLKDEEDVLCPSPNKNSLENSNMNILLPLIEYYSSKMQELDLSNSHFISFKGCIDKAIQKEMTRAGKIDKVKVIFIENGKQVVLSYYLHNDTRSCDIINLNFDE